MKNADRWIAKFWSRVRKRLRGLRDSAYGSVPAEAGPGEGLCVKLTPVDDAKRGAVIHSGQSGNSRRNA